MIYGNEKARCVISQISLLAIRCFIGIFITFNLSAQSINITGQVVDRQDDTPLPFATIFIQDNKRGTISNSEGFFIMKIDTIRASDTLVISYLGYKLYKISLQNFENLPSKFALTSFPNTLSEIVVTPLSARERFLKAVAKIDTHFLNTPFLLEGYYAQEMSEDNQSVIFREALIKIYHDHYLDSLPERQIQVVQGHRVDQPEEIDFWRKKIEKYRSKSIKKLKRKAKKDSTGITRRIDSVKTGHPALELMAGLGRPEIMFEIDPIRFLKEFEPTDKKGKELYRYQIIGHTYYQGRSTAIFEVIDIEEEEFKFKFYISDNDEIMLISCLQPNIEIPSIAKVALYVLGLGIKAVGIDYQIYYRPIRDKWYLAYEKMVLKCTLIDRNLFKANEMYDYTIDFQFVSKDVYTENVEPIPVEKRIDPQKNFDEQLGIYDMQFWKKYHQTNEFH